MKKKIIFFIVFLSLSFVLFSTYNEYFKKTWYTVEIRYEINSNLSADENFELRDKIKEKVVSEFEKDNIEIKYNVSQSGLLVVKASKKEIKKYRSHKNIEGVTVNHGYDIEGL